ncbi:hypothetical protein [Winogradskyella sp. PC D3.3]
MKSLILIDSVEINDYYKNGKPKVFGLVKYYKHGEYVYEMKVGKCIWFYKGGSKTVTVYDNWGADLSTYY